MPNPILRIKRSIRYIGPGVITGASDLDPSAIATYTQAGARFGFNLLWIALFLFPLLAAVQELCARVGVVTGKGIVAVIRDDYGKGVLYFFVVLIAAANTITLGADIGAMAEAARLIVPLPSVVLIAFFTVLMLFLQLFVSYPSYAKILKSLALALLAYPLTVIILGESWRDLLRATLVPNVRFQFDFLFIVTGILGAGLSPYMYIWQASEEVEEEIAGNCLPYRGEGQRVTDRFMRRIRIDTVVGMLASVLAAWSILVVAAAVLNRNDILDVKTAAQAAMALEPLVQSFPHSGILARSLFAVGVIGLGFLAVPVLAGSASYAVTESFGWREGLNLKFRQARGFYGVIVSATLIGFFLNFTGINPFKALVFASVFNGIVAGPLLYVILKIGLNEAVMGNRRSGKLSCILVSLATILLGLAAIGMLLTIPVRG